MTMNMASLISLEIYIINYSIESLVVAVGTVHPENEQSKMILVI